MLRPLVAASCTTALLGFYVYQHSNLNGQLDRLAVGGDPYPPERRLFGTRLVAKGSTHFHFYVLPICTAVLYLEPHTANWDVLHDCPKVLEICYHRAITASDFRQSTEAVVQRNGLWTPRVAALLKKFNALYKDVSPGDRYVLEYHPKHSVTLRLNGHILGHVGKRDMEFGRALFSVWFGERSFHATFRADLLRPLARPGGGQASREL